MAILDMGVGGGRTSPHLAKDAARYVGADYSKAMVEACRTRFPALEFRHCDATDMAQFGDASFDAMVFSFNGIDYIPTGEGWALCLAEAARVLRPGGVFIFSSHNARTVGLWPLLDGAKPHQMVWRILLSAYRSVVIAFRMLGSGVYQAGEGYILDPVHGGVRTYVSTLYTLKPQLDRAGFDLVEMVGAHYPIVTARTLTPWYYYVCSKRQRA